MSLVRIVTLIFGVVYVIVGILGFLGEPLVTDASHADMESASGDLLGIFPINALHNVVTCSSGQPCCTGRPSMGAPC